MEYELKKLKMKSPSLPLNLFGGFFEDFFRILLIRTEEFKIKKLVDRENCVEFYFSGIGLVLIGKEHLNK
jgi:hypothetical protein